jgi:hypothetical protein
MNHLLTTPAGAHVRDQLLTMLQQAGDLHARAVLTPPEHDQLRAILLAAVQRLAPDDGDILDAVPVEGDPNALDVLDAVDLLSQNGDDPLDALEIEGRGDADVLDALDLGGEVLDAVDLGDVDDSDAFDVEPLDGSARDKEGIVDELPLGVIGADPELDFGGDLGGSDGGGFPFNLSLDDPQ